MTRQKGITDRKTIAAFIGEMLQQPPSSPFDLLLRIKPFDAACLRTELVRILMETKLSEQYEFQLVQWLVEINPENAAIPLLDAVADPSLSTVKRALAFVLLTKTHERELHERMRALRREQQLEVVLAAQRWITNLTEQDGISESATKRRAPGRPRAAGKKSDSSPQATVCRLKITLRDIRPPIWRRIEVRDDITLARLHRILQVVTGWTDSHLHAFRVGKTTYGIPDAEWPDDTLSAKKMTLRSLIEDGVKRFVYEYDFGDGWMHDIVIERTKELKPGARSPLCLAGKRACPPEDCGGPWGYAELLEALADPKHPAHRDMRSWAGDFDPDQFDLIAVNRALRKVR